MIEKKGQGDKLYSERDKKRKYIFFRYRLVERDLRQMHLEIYYYNERVSLRMKQVERERLVRDREDRDTYMHRKRKASDRQRRQIQIER